jgi:hypothetical protein
MNSTSAFSDNLNAQQINAVVKACVAVSRAQEQEVPGATWRFDAFYNAATGMVQNNVQYNFQQRFLFVFQKCMAEKGLPLGPAVK